MTPPRSWADALSLARGRALRPARDALRDAVTAAHADTLILPFVAWARALHARAAGPIVLGVSGPQGGGKSTLAAHAVEALGAQGLRAITLSIDDVYLPRDAQRALAARHPGNPYLAVRGAPGTHDVDLGGALLDALRARGAVTLPRYDKGAFDGEGDRAPPSAWRTVEAPFDVVVFEGWMLGFTPSPRLDRVPHLGAVNGLLRAYDAWTARLDGLLHLDVDDLERVVRWRVESEQRRRAAEGRGLSDAGAEAYIRRFLPLYRAYLPGLRADGLEGRPTLRVALGADRLPRP
ncbi:MAG: hypothetical protein U0325_29705 [Polyangiales bacterium]